MRSIRFAIQLLILTLPVLAYAQSPFSQTGEASYYADKFHGRTTASGEKYDKNAFTCAHLSLPYGTTLRVTNLDNGKSTVVRVNDRGPFSPNRIIDLSRVAAEQIGMIAAGKAKVKIESVPASELKSTPAPVASTPAPAPAPTSTPAPTAPKPSAPKAPAVTTADAQTPAESPKGDLYQVKVTSCPAKGFAVQIGSYQGVTNLFRQIENLGIPNVTVFVTGDIPQLTYKLLVGPFASRAEAENQRARLQARFPDCFILAL